MAFRLYDRTLCVEVYRLLMSAGVRKSKFFENFQYNFQKLYCLSFSIDNSAEKCYMAFVRMTEFPEYLETDTEFDTYDVIRP